MFQGYFLYYPSPRDQPAVLSALIDILRLSDYTTVLVLVCLGRQFSGRATLEETP